MNAYFLHNADHITRPSRVLLRPVHVSWKLTSWVVITTQLLTPYSGRLFAATQPTPYKVVEQSEPAVKVTPNRALPKVTPPCLVPQFSETPTDAEFFHSHVLATGLVPIGGQTSPSENKDLAGALLAFVGRRTNDDFTSLTSFLDRYPHSAWRASLLLSLGKAYRDTGYLSRALAAWEEGWSLSGKSDDPAAKPIADEMAGELTSLYSQVGRVSAVEKMLAELDGRPLSGAAVERIALAREGLWVMKTHPEQGFMCGPYSLYCLRAASGLRNVNHKILQNAASTPKGTSLAQLKQWADQMDMHLQMARRRSGAEIPVPSVVHWKAGHFAALLKHDGDRFYMKDMVFQREMWMSRAAVEDESSGYFLVPDGPLPAGWESAQIDQAAEIWGSGPGATANANHLTPHDKTTQTCPKPTPMAQYNVHAAVLSLEVFDTPLRYQPPRGPAIQFGVTYNQCEVSDFTTLNFGNMGPTFHNSYFSYVNSPSSALGSGASVDLYVQGGGKDTYTGYNTTTGNFALQSDTRTILHQNSITNYVLSFPDASTQIYDCAMPLGTSYAVLLTKIIDPFGNTNSLTYDSDYRLVAITDAIGQTNIIRYGSTDTNSVAYYQIATVTDPFGRFATFNYETSSPYRLIKITDVIGITSQFTWGTNNFLSSLTTPYGTTTFNSTQAADGGGAVYSRSIVASDPQGASERSEFEGYGVNALANPEPVPSGILGDGSLMQYRDTFFWDKNAMAQAPGDYTKAKVFHWLHYSTSPGVASRILESEKAPLESRVWYNYPGQTDAFLEANITNTSPSATARILDDGSTQLYQAQYANIFGMLTKAVDPIGRTTLYNYSTNGIDLLSVQQLNSGGTDLLTSVIYTNHLPLFEVDAAGQTNYFGYNSYGQLTAMTNAIGNTVALSYDANGYLTNVTGSLPGATTSYTYDGYGRVQTVTDSDGYTLTYNYDNLDRITRVTHPDNTYEQTVYQYLDPILNRDRRGHWSSVSYDSLRRVRDVQDSLNRVTHYEWCGCGSLESITDPMGKITSWVRDIEGRPTIKIFPDQTQIHYAYGANSGRLVSVTDAKNQTRLYTYFADNNLQQVSYSNAVVSTPSVSYNYDTSYNRMLTMIDGVGTNTYAYYPVTNNILGAGRLQSVTGPWGNSTVVYQYDALGRTTNQSIAGVSSDVTLDALGRVTKVDNALGTFTNIYAGVSPRLLWVSNYNGLNTTFAYFGTNNDMRLQTIWHKNGSGNTVSRFDYTYDADSQIQTWTQQADTTSTNTLTVQYDPVDQLMGAVLAQTGVASNISHQYVYSYDPSGNRTGEQIDSSPVGANYNALNQLTNQVGNGMVLFGGNISKTGVVSVAEMSASITSQTNFSAYANVQNGTNVIQIAATDLNLNKGVTNYQLVVTNGTVVRTLTYDLNGNLINNATATATNTYEWDAANRFTAITVVTNSITYRSEFLYDGSGRRVQIVEKINGVVISTKRFLWCGTELCEERDSTGTNITKRFFSQGEQISGANYFYTRDHLGSVREFLDSGGTIRARYGFDSYGRRTKIVGDLDADFGFTSHYYHPTSGLLLALSRAYDPNAGRWINRDPLAEAAGINLYAYVANDPINAIDPNGTFILSLGFLGYDLYKLGKNIYNGSASVSDGLWVAADVLAVAADVLSGGTGGEALEMATQGARATQVAAKALEGAKAIGAVDLAYAGVRAGPFAADVATQMAKCPNKVPKYPKEVEAFLDDTGRLHGRPLPDPGDLGSYDPDSLRRLLDDLNVSIPNRIQNTANLGSNLAHDARLTDEVVLRQALIRYLQHQ